MNIKENSINEGTDNLVGKRILYQNQKATIRYSGPLTHDGRPEGSDKQHWIGLEWDDVSRGRHNGTVKDVTYFVTKDNQPSGSLMKVEKAEFGRNILDAVIEKYFKNCVSDNYKEMIAKQILQSSDEVAEEASKLKVKDLNSEQNNN